MSESILREESVLVLILVGLDLFLAEELPQTFFQPHILCSGLSEFDRLQHRLPGTLCELKFTLLGDIPKTASFARRDAVTLWVETINEL